ncbi:MAG: SAM-dependent chlorinase/fluorinase [Pseudomonadota bacterium]
MIFLFTDFGVAGPYVGQMKAVLHRHAPTVPVIDLFADAPVHNIHANAYLLAAYAESFEKGTVFLAVVDPGVGSEDRPAVVVNCDGRWFVGPGNGLFDVVIRRGQQCQQWEILWRPEHLSSSFHGRDLFAPVAAMLATDQQPDLELLPVDKVRLLQLPEELAEVIYIDHFGNLISGIRASALGQDACLHYHNQLIPRVKTFANVASGSPLCYENSNGLLEIALNQGRAEDHFGAKVGDVLRVVTPQA